MSPISMSSRRLSTRKIFAIIAGISLVLLTVGYFFEPLRFLNSTIIGITTGMLIALQNRPIMWKEADRIIFQHPTKKIEKSNPLHSKVKFVIEWDGYEGTLYDVIWTDGDLWTFPAGYGVSLKRIMSVLKQCGFNEVPTLKDWRVFRPENAETGPLTQDVH